MDLSELEQMGGGGMPSAEDMQQRQEQVRIRLFNSFNARCVTTMPTAHSIQQAQMEEQRRSILDQILEPAAKDRLIRLSLVKKEKARFMEDHLIKAATSGQLRSKVNFSL